MFVPRECFTTYCSNINILCNLINSIDNTSLIFAFIVPWPNQKSLLHANGLFEQSNFFVGL